MNNAWSSFDWTIARAGGFTALLLLTLAVASGLAMSVQWQSSSKWPRIINNALHNFLTLMSTIFVGLHILTLWIDPFTHFNWYEMFIPLTSSYRPLWTAFGIIGLYLGIAIGISTLLRSRIGYRWWRRLHVFTILIYTLVIIHGITSGSDTTTWWGYGIYTLCILTVCPFLVLRLIKLARPPRQRPQSQARPAPDLPLRGQPMASRPAPGSRRI